MNRQVLEATRPARLVFLLGALALTLIVACCSGCAQLEQFTDDHPQAVVVVEVGALAVGGIMVAHVIAHGSGRTVVQNKPPVAPISVSCLPACAQ